MRNIFAHLAAVAVVFGLFIGSTQAEEKAEVGKAAPAFSLTDQDGNTVSLSDFEDKIVVLEWFNIECPYVVRHHEREKGIPNLAEKYAEQDVVWLAINSSNDQDVAHNKRTHERLNLSYPILEDQSGNVGRLYGATHTPHIYVINTQGVLVYAGAIDNDPRGRTQPEERVNYADQALRATLAGETVTTDQTRAYGCTIKY
jgi:peroxiredoxin